jgi:hypothetical protein
VGYTTYYTLTPQYTPQRLDSRASIRGVLGPQSAD